MIKFFNHYARPEAVKSVAVTRENIVYVNFDHGIYDSKQFDTRKQADKAAAQMVKQLAKAKQQQ